jgi:O-antigen/teichoic acid export membrane protein
MGSSVVARYAVANYLRLGVTIASQVLLIPALVRNVGTESYGLYALVVSALSLCALLEFGAGVGALRAVAGADADDPRSHDVRNATLSTLTVVTTLVGVLTLVALLALLPGAPSLLRVPAPLHDEARGLLLFLGLRSAVLPWPLGVFRGALIGRGDVALANGIQAGATALYAVVALILLPHGLGLVGFGALSLAAFLVEHAAYLFYCWRRIPGLRVSPRLFDRARLRDALALGGAQTLVSLAGILLLRTDPLIVGWRLSLEAVAIYAVALKVAEQGLNFVKQFANALPPIVASLDGRGDRKGLARLLVDGTRLSLLPAGLVGLPFFFLGGELLGLWMGPDFVAAGAPLAVLALATALTAPQFVLASLFTYTGRYSWTGRIAALTAAVNVTASLCLVGPLGLVGVALGSLVAVILVDLVYAGWLAARAHEVPLLRLWTQGLGRPMVAALVGAAVAPGLGALMPGPAWLTLAAKTAVLDLVFLLAFCLVAVRPEERAALLARAARLWPGTRVAPATAA